MIDATGMIVMPGFVDSHRHIWEGLLRNIGTDVPLEGRSGYISFVLHKLAPAFRPEDAYIGDLVSALGAIDAGITTLLDWSHIQGSPAHTDAVIQALKDSGLRAVFAYGFPWWGKWEERQPSWFCGRRPSTSPRRTSCSRWPWPPRAPSSPTSRCRATTGSWPERPGRRITTHVGVGSSGQDAKVQEMGEAGLLGPDTTYIHCTTLNDTEIQMIVDSGGHGVARLAGGDDDGPRDAADPEVPRPGPPAQPERGRGDERARRHVQPDALGPRPAARPRRGPGQSPLTPAEVLACATIEGARANGLDDKMGSLRPGKQADIILLRTDRLNVTPLNDPATAVVAGMDTGNVDTVLVAGRLMKRHGKLLHVDWPGVAHGAESRDHVVAKSGFKVPSI